MIGDLVDLVEEVGDEDDGEPVVAQLAHDLEERRRLLVIQTGGRFIEDEHARLDVERAGNGDHLLDGHRTGIQLRADIEF